MTTPHPDLCFPLRLALNSPIAAPIAVDVQTVPLKTGVNIWVAVPLGVEVTPSNTALAKHLTYVKSDLSDGEVVIGVLPLSCLRTSK